MNSILSIYQTNKGAFDNKSLQQILGLAGDGKLKDGNKTSLDFREFLEEIPSQLIKQFAINCLTDGFQDSGLALQDVINQIGARLSFSVDYGLYRGKQNDIGFDGIWVTKEGHSIVVEVKTTDTYRINLDTIAHYRNKLIDQQKISKDNSSILIVVGREDTGDLEAQIRGSRHAWDIRLLSTDALLKLFTLRETFNDAKTIQQIAELLKPREYTRIDQLIDLIFQTSQDLQSEEDFEEPVEILKEKAKRKSASNKEPPISFHDQCLKILEEKLKTNLMRQSRIAFANKDKTVGLICANSKPHEHGKFEKFWFAFHPHQEDFLQSYKNAYVAFGCGSAANLLLIPFKDFQPLVKNMGTTEREQGMYWHVVIHYRENKYLLGQPGKERGSMLDISNYKL